MAPRSMQAGRNLLKHNQILEQYQARLQARGRWEAGSWDTKQIASHLISPFSVEKRISHLSHSVFYLLGFHAF